MKKPKTETSVKMSDEGVSEFFPDQIICEILTRLPAKSICRFTCVSKRWLSLISSPHFISSYLSHSAPLWAILDSVIRVEKGPKDLTLSLSLAEPPNVSSFSVAPHMVVEDLVDPSSGEFPFVIAGSSGLLLLAISREHYEDTLVLCNPITGQLIELPEPPSRLNDRRAIGLATRASGPGWSVPSFVVTEYQPLIGSNSATLVTFSSESGKWKEKSTNYMLDMHLWRPGGAIDFDGHLVWTDMSCGLIVWDDPFSRKKKVRCRFIPLPEGCWRRFDTPRLEEERCIGVGGGCIQYLEVVDGEFLRLWRLNDYGGGEWGLVHKVSLMDVWSDESYLACGLPRVTPVVLSIHPFEVDIAFFAVRDHIFSLNAEKKNVLSCGVCSSLTRRMWFLPFVLPSWPTSFSPLLLAPLAKDRRNDYFKEKNFNEAIDYFSKSIHHLPTAIAYAKRAAAYLKLSGYLQAENYCTEALKLDDQHTKAYTHRAVARKELGDSKEDAELCLKLDSSQNMEKLLA